MTIKIPEKFKAILEHKNYGLINSIVNQLKDIYNDNKLEFFQEYTDHGIEHVEKVLETAENLIDDESMSLLNERDVTVLITAILLHDLGMHISSEGLKKILSEEFKQWKVAKFDSKSWSEEWISFFHEAKRFNDEQLKNIFGNTDQIIIDPDLDLLDKYTRKLYGEFLRRLHHRLAHEIALAGFPTKIGEPNIVIFESEFEQDLIDIAGLVARSHGLPIRKAVDYLEDKFSYAWKSPYGVKAVFLMVVLRIADYLQIQSDRASKILIKSKAFDSPVSKKEWEKHNAIKDINIQTDDPERIFVLAKPENSVIYLELEKLFQDIQYELDTSWAILGEAYGKDNELRKLKIRFRRIRSLFDNKEEFEKTINYVPEKILFNADPALLKLLIGPLYGEDPTYGVRELLQNAVDAVKERSYLKNTNGKVTISLTPIKTGKQRYELTISDTGIGMSKDTVINYFFKAGASFRKSMEWKKNFVDDNEVKIQKTGRFGVGVLAVFLLGDEFELWTKYDSNDSQGYYCKASLGMTQVELIKEDCAVGTTLKIPLKESANSIINKTLIQISNNAYNPRLLNWFIWYTMDFPKIDYKIDKDLKKAFKISSLLVSSKSDRVSDGWHSFSTVDYQSVHWTIDNDFGDYHYDADVSNRFFNHLVCNGFRIKKEYSIKDNSYQWQKPKLSVFDNNGTFPLSLNRDYIIDDQLPFEEQLLENISLEIISTLLKTKFIRVNSLYVPQVNKLDILTNLNLSDYILILEDEFTLLDPSLFLNLKLSSFFQFFTKRQVLKQGNSLDVQLPYQAFIISGDTNKFYKSILENYDYQLWFSISKNFKVRDEESSRKYVRTSKLNYLLQGTRLNKGTRESMSKNDFQNGWSEIVSKNVSKNKLISQIELIDETLYPVIIERFIDAKNNNNFFLKTWEKYLGQEWSFPINFDKRPTLKQRQ